MKFKKMDIEEKKILNLSQEEKFEIHSLKSYENKIIAYGYYYKEVWPQKSILSAEFSKNIESSNDIFSLKIEEWVTDIDYDEKVYTIDDVAELLGVKRDRAWKLVNNNVLIDPKEDQRGKRYWLVNEVLKAKPFIEKSKWDLIRYILKKEL